jgi:hypothetical protein
MGQSADPHSKAAEIMLAKIVFRAILGGTNLNITGSFWSNDHSPISGRLEGRAQR